MSSYSNLSKEQLIEEIERLKRRKRFGLIWEDKPEDVAELCKTKLPVLVGAPKNEVMGDLTRPTHLLIEGDNYHALSVLNFTHPKSINVIYIDPPYNRGDKDFKYNDRYVDIEDAYRHSKWLSFLEKRLRLARNLLRDTGVILISIDDNEVAQLKLLCDEIFGPDNFISTLVWEGALKNDSKFVSASHDYVLCYAKSKNEMNKLKVTWRGKKIGIDEIYQKVETFKKKFRNDYETISEKLKEWYSSLDKNHPSWWHRHYNCVDENGVYFAGDISAESGRSRPLYEVLHPKTGKPCKAPVRGWPTKGTLDQWIKEGRIHWGDDHTVVPKVKRYLKDTENMVIPSVFYKDRRAARKSLKKILGEDLFDNPKDVDILKILIEATSNNDGIILDFFAGSGATGHAVLELNKEGSNRQFILCTNNENNICEDVCYPRVKKVITGYKVSKGKKVAGLGGSLRYYRTDFVYAEPTDGNKKKLTAQATEMLCLKEGTFGAVINKKAFKVFKNANHYTGIIFDHTAIPDFKQAIQKIKDKFSVYVFSLGDDTFDEEFDDVKRKVKLSPIPEAILRVYRRIFK